MRATPPAQRVTSRDQQPAGCVMSFWCLDRLMGDHRRRMAGYQGEPRHRLARISSCGERTLNDSSFAGLCPAEIVVPQRQGADALAGDLEDGVTHRWRNR